MIAVDQRGHGLSGTPDEYGFDAVTEDLRGAVKTLELDRPVVVGHSWGGSVALAFAAAHPDMTRGIVMVDGGFMDLSQHLDWEQAEKQMRPPEFDGAPLEGFVRAMKSWPNISDLWSEELADMVLSNLVIRDEKVYRRLSIPNHMKIAKAIYDLSTSEMLASLAVPGLAISCERQTQGQLESAWMESRRAGLERLRETAPNVRVVVMEDTIHDVPIQRPKELAALITEFASHL